ncbi:MAG TPA: hypothetical protein VK400_01855, partial [Pyrinomonadaceae bacterium]|nr:hypothetical protein [Pyrinomonadaceae bacterium]
FDAFRRSPVLSGIRLPSHGQKPPGRHETRQTGIVQRIISASAVAPVFESVTTMHTTQPSAPATLRFESFTE